jgi:CheY-like chemotaxis protein
MGIESVLAINGAEAVALVGQQTFDLVLMDIHMPVMDGLEATRRIRDTHPADSLPIVAMTADAFSEDRDRCLAAGMNDHIAKPLDMKTFPATIRRWLQR